MAVFKAPVRFFLGANTPTGFVGFSDEVYDAHDGWRAYLIKSGAGTGKSSLIRKVYQAMTDNGIEAEVICCSSDPSSLDGVVCSQLKLCLLDATAPHVVEPRFWGAVEQIVPLAICLDEQALHSKVAEIASITQENQALHARCRKYMHAAGALLRENRRIGESLVDEQKVRRLARRIAKQEWGDRNGNGKLTHRFLSAITPEGQVTLYETLQTLCPRIYTIEDEQGAAARLFLDELARCAQAAGVDGIACPCPLAPADGAEHLLFPAAGVGFTTSNTFHKADFPVYRRIHATRFMDVEPLRAKRQIQSFNRRAARELLEQASALSAEAKTVHDAMEAYNIAVMDWARAEKIGERVLQVFLDAARQYNKQ